MARFDVHRQRGSTGYLLDCQADILSHLNTRFVVPLLDPVATPPLLPRLHPCFTIDGRQLVMATHLASTVPLALLGEGVVSLADAAHRIMNALDMLLTGH